MGEPSATLIDGEETERLIEDAQAALLAWEGAEKLGPLADALAKARDDIRTRFRDVRGHTRSRVDPDAGASRGEMQTLRSHLTRLGRLHHRVSNELLEAKLYDTCATKLGGMGRVRALDGLIFVLIMVVIGMLCVECTRELSAEARDLFMWIDTAICAVFLGEFFFKLFCSESRGWYFRRHWIDFVASIPFAWIARMEYVRLGRLARLLRAGRLIRAVRVIRVVVFLQSRVGRSIQKNRTVLDREYELSLDTVRRHLEELSERKRTEQAAESRLTAWLVRELESSWLAKMAQRLTFGMVKRRGTDRGTRERAESRLVKEAAGVGKRLADVAGGVHSIVQHLCDFNGIVTTPQLVNYLGQAMFKAGKRRGIVLFGVGAFGALSGYVIKQTFGPVIVPPKAQQISVASRAPEADLSFGKALCGRRGSKMRIALVHGDPKRPGPVAIQAMAMEDEGVFELAEPKGLPKAIEPGRPVEFELVFRPPKPGTYRNALIVTRGDGSSVRRTAVGVGIDSWAHRFAKRSRESFGLNFVLISLPFLAIAVLGRAWVKKSKQVTADFKNIAEASFLNLLEDAKKVTIFDDLCWLYDEVLARETVLDHGRTVVEEQERSIRRKIDAFVAERRATTADYSVRDIGYDRSVFPAEGERGLFTPEELAMTREGFVLEAIHVISRGHPVASLHNPYGGTAIQLYRDYLDGALFHETDRKTIEQLLGNITIRHVLNLIHYTKEDTKRIQRLAAPFGPNLWLTFICRSIAEQTGRLVSEFNASCVPLRDLGPDDVRGDRALREQYEKWLAGGAPIRADSYMTQEFTAMHFLVEDAGQDERVRVVFGDRALAKLRRDRCRMIRTVFGTYPWGQLVKVNPYQLYQSVFGRDVRTEIQMGRLRRALGLPKGIFRTVTLPLRLLLLVLRGIMFALKWAKKFVLNILADIETEQERPDFDAALRKITRMRGAVIAETVAIRARFDCAYLGAVTVEGDRGPETSRCTEDLGSISANPGATAFYEQLREERQNSLRELEEFLATADVSGLGGEAMRGVQTAYVLNAHDLQTLAGAERRIEAVEQRLEEQDFQWPKGKLRKSVAHGLLWALTLGHDRATETYRAFCELSGRGCGREGRRLFAAYLTNVDGVRDAIDASVETDGQPRDRALRLVEDIRKGGYEEWTAGLITVRTVHALSLLDRRNYEVSVYKLGRFGEVGAELPERQGAACAGGVASP